MGLGIITAAVGALGARKNRKDMDKLLKKAPKYKINDEAFENQNIARAEAFGRDRAIQMKQEQLEQDTANSVSEVKDVTSSTSSLLSAIAAIEANKSDATRALAQDEAALMNQKKLNLMEVNRNMIDEKDKEWNYNVNMPFQMKVAATRDKRKANEELTLKGIESQATTDAAAMESFGNMFGGLMGGG